ncbi:hypothetical protein IWC96_11025 [Brevundimonas sp. BAL450]|uniref:hypothetical protein n=1 Tax=Brevundimonas sp. BAL450 TaxID=1708162 RepID=UPI0018CACE75|nr:hypothetical protein [Brevundimonas sp. BAL450]MBG7615807.1 hypothetical protein [Brevundimonas sp. BAL450]
MTTVPPVSRGALTGDARRWAAARDEYLAGSPAEAVCRRHDLRLSTFRRHAREQGWRRMDQEPDAPSPQDDPLVIPDGPSGASRDAPQRDQQATPLTAVQMVEKAWSHVQAAVAAGRLIEARGWLRLYKDLKPFARYEEIAAREARMEQASADRRAAEAPADEEPLVIPEAPSGAIRDIAPPLHCFSAPESHEPPPADDDPAAAAEAAAPISTSDLVRLATRLAAVAEQVEQAAHDEAVRLSLHCFSPSESHDGPPDPLDQAMRQLQSEILGLRGAEPRSEALPGAP